MVSLASRGGSDAKRMERYFQRHKNCVVFFSMAYNCIHRGVVIDKMVVVSCEVAGRTMPLREFLGIERWF